MADENTPKAARAGENPRLEWLVLRNVPFVGSYSSRVFEVKHQSTVPSDLREILKIRQGVKDTKDVVLFCQMDEGCIYLLDSPEEGSCPNISLVRMDIQGRIVLPANVFTKMYANYTGRKSYIEVIPSDTPLYGSQSTE